jgi:ABC-2 type transport system ATP-binding protein
MVIRARRTERAEYSSTRPGERAVVVREVSRRFRKRQALNSVSLEVRKGEIHALLGPNGAGKTTMLRILVGLLDPDEGHIEVLGRPWTEFSHREARRLFGLIPSGDRSFYLRISALENLVFFARLYGISRPRAIERARWCLNAVGLKDEERTRVGVFSHGMQKRLSVARALLVDPPVLFVDEATHDLDPAGARKIQGLVTDAARNGAGVIWTTQRVDEIREFAQRVTVLDKGTVRFSGTVPQLMATVLTRGYVLQLRRAAGLSQDLLATAQHAVGNRGTVRPLDQSDGGHYQLSLRDDALLGDVFASLASSGVEILACREGRSEIEEALLQLTNGAES